MMPYIIAGLSGFTVFVFCLFVRSLYQTDKVYVGNRYRHVDEDFFMTELEKAAEKDASFFGKVIESVTGILLLRSLLRIFGMDLEKIDDQIRAARLQKKYNSLQIAVMRIIGLVGLCVFGFLAFTFKNLVFFIIGLLIFQMLYTKSMGEVTDTIKQRKKDIERDLPAFVERVQMCLIGGAPILQAIEDVAMSTPGPLSEEMVDAIKGQSTNVNFLEGSLEAKAEELGIVELSSFISNVLIAQRRGVPIATVLENEVTKMHRLFFAQMDEIVSKTESRAMMYQILGGFIPTMILAIVPPAITFMESM